MTAEQFCYWLQGFLEMGDPKELSESQTKMLKQHLNLVFVNVTGIVPGEPPAEEKQVLTDSATDADRAAVRDKLRKDILDGSAGSARGGFWDRGTIVACDSTSFCGATGISGRGAKIC